MFPHWNALGRAAARRYGEVVLRGAGLTVAAIDTVDGGTLFRTGTVSVVTRSLSSCHLFNVETTRFHCFWLGVPTGTALAGTFLLSALFVTSEHRCKFCQF